MRLNSIIGIKLLKNVLLLRTFKFIQWLFLKDDICNEFIIWKIQVYINVYRLIIGAGNVTQIG